MKRLFLFILPLLCAGKLQAKEVTPEQALQTADRFWQSAPATRAATAPRWQRIQPDESSATRTAASHPAYYIFDNTAGGGFVIVAGDDAVRPVLGYSFENEFPAEGLPENLRAWLDGMSLEVNNARAAGDAADPYMASAWAETRAGTPVVEMETALWNQEAPYNNLCPRSSVGTRTFTGCTTTALAIIMRYHQWPERGSGTLAGYHIDMNDITVPEIQLGHAYDWANMLMKYGYSYQYTDTEATAVATLMRDCAIMLQSNFGIVGSSGTSAALERIPNALISYMDYDKQTRYVYRRHYTATSWNEMMRNEMDNHRPVLYSGYGPHGSGHAFVLDGYTDDDYFHVNWGWGGTSNGYFLLTALNPNGQGAGASDTNTYNLNQVVVIGIQKDQGNDYRDELRMVVHENYTGLSTDGQVVTGQPFTLHIGNLFNNSTRVFNGEVMIAVTDKNGQIIEELETFNYSGYSPGAGNIFDHTLTVRSTILPGYRIRAYYRSTNMTDWAIVYANEESGCVWDLLIDDAQSIEETTSLTFDRKSRQLQLQIKEGVTTTLLDSGGADRTSACRIDGQTISIDTSDLTAGTYRLVLQKRNDRKELRFTVSAR